MNHCGHLLHLGLSHHLVVSDVTDLTDFVLL